MKELIVNNPFIFIAIILLFIVNLLIGKAIAEWYFNLKKQFENQDKQIKLLESISEKLGGSAYFSGDEQPKVDTPTPKRTNSIGRLG